MRIQHNIMALSAYRCYRSNTGALSKDLEKLSSGYRINRAGDDAAGLSISEKMRAQITGLSAARKNVKDGISLVRVAEGAMQEIQDMLNRMDYLAVQSANGTYQDEIDRVQLQKEVGQLCTEIDRIADSANFNGIKLLDGSKQRIISEAAGASGAEAAALSRMLARTAVTAGSGGAEAAALSGVSARAAAVPAKEAVFEFDFNTLAGTYYRGDSIQIILGDNSKTETFSFWPSAQSGMGYPTGTVTGNDLAYRVFEKLKTTPEYTMNGQTFVLSGEGSVLRLVQKDAPADESQLVDGTNATFTVTVNRVKPSEIVGTPKVNAAFGDKVSVEGSSETTFDFRNGTTYELKGTMTLIDFKADELVDEMRRVGIKGEKLNTLSDVRFRVFYIEDEKNYCIALDNNNEGPIVKSKVVTDENGVVLPVDKLIPKAGETIVLDFGEIGKVQIAADKNKDLTVNDFRGGGGGALWVLKAAPHANGGSIEFKITDAQRRKLADKADELAVSSPDPANTKLPVDITMQWNDTSKRFELISLGPDRTNSVVIAASETRPVDKIDDIQFYINPNDKTTLVATATFTKPTSEAITASAFEGGVATGLQFREPDYDNRTTTPRNATFTAGALEVPATPDQPDPPGPPKPPGHDPGPDDPTPPGPGPDDPTPPGPGPGPDDPTPPGPGLDDPTPPGPGTDVDYDGGLILQIGDTADEFNRMRVFISDMHTNAMGTRDKNGELVSTIRQVNIGSQTGAQDAVAVIRDAINYVSGVRGDLGAYQNRLEHTGNNLSVMTENIQDAESTIRDTDMAQQMMSYVKDNILLQSAQAMLAQANVVPQGVLQLLG